MRKGAIEIGRFGSFILFLLLEIVAFYLIVQFNREQRGIFFHSTNLMSSTMYSRVDDVRNYFLLRNISDSLAAENATLYNRQPNFNYLIYNQSDTIQIDNSLSQFIATPARVRSNSINRRNNNIIIDKGTADGIHNDMGVISSNGVVGKTRLCTQHFCSVLPLLHSQSKISASIKHDGYFGNLEWRSSNPRIVTLDGIPKQATVKIGDTIVTSGYSLLFPQGLPIGYISDFYLPSGSNFYDIDVHLFTNMANLQYIYVIRNTFQDEIDSVNITDN